jgi:hypothetical protein
MRQAITLLAAVLLIPTATAIAAAPVESGSAWDQGLRGCKPCDKYYRKCLRVTIVRWLRNSNATDIYVDSS